MCFYHVILIKKGAKLIELINDNIKDFKNEVFSSKMLEIITEY